MSFRMIAATAILATSLALPALAANPNDDIVATARTAPANQLGVLEYCVEKGYADASAVAAQRAVVSKSAPAPGGNDAAEALGRAGTVSAGGTKSTVGQLAVSRHTTQHLLCKLMSDAAKSGR